MSEWHEEAREEYKKIGEVACPAFPNEMVVFNAKGFSHLMYQGSSKEKARPEKEARNRVELVGRAVKLLRMMPLPQEESTYEFEGKKYRYWAFEAVVDDKRIKVVVRQCGNGKKHFWSVIPAWRKTRFETRNARGSLRKI
ncbi:MAG: hypothetical protein Fur0011_2970 [Candidatus Microgenomates bacterium]